MTGEIETLADEVLERHKLSSLHIFTEAGAWRVFGFRRDAKGYQASVETGRGEDMYAAIWDLDVRLKEGPIHK